MVRTLCIGATTLLLSGCGVVFPYESSGPCPQIGDGVCDLLRNVYDATNGRDHLNASDLGGSKPPERDGASSPTGASDGADASAGQGSGTTALGDGVSRIADAGTVNVLPVSLNGEGVLPLRTPPDIMRIWVAPWESDQGDLVMSGYVFTELRDRRWQIGSEPIFGVGRLKPIESASLMTAAAAASATAAKVVPGPQPPAESGVPAIPPRSVRPDRPIVRAATGAQPATPQGSFWQTVPDGPAIQ